MGRKLGAFAAGTLAGFVAMLAVGFIAGMIYPLSGEVDARDPEGFASILASAPLGARLSILLGWFTAGLAGSAVAKLVSKRRGPAWAVAIFFALFVVLNVMMLPMPTWMQVVAIAAPLLGGLLGSHIKDRATAPAPQDTTDHADAQELR